MDVIVEPLLSVVVNEDVVDGVIGGGDDGNAGESGHRNRGLDAGSVQGYDDDDDAGEPPALRGLPTTCCDAERMRCFRLEKASRAGLLLPPVRGGGESGVPGVEQEDSCCCGEEEEEEEGEEMGELRSW